jgi:hypothetical protein
LDHRRPAAVRGAWYLNCDNGRHVQARINVTRRLKEAVMSQKNSNSGALTVKSAIRAGGYNRADQPDPPNRKQRKTKKTRRLTLAQFGVNEQGLPTFTWA